MARLGEFGAAQKEYTGERDQFGFFGEEFTVTGSIPPMLMLQLAASATGKIEEAEGMAAMWEALRTSLTAPEVVRPAHDDETPDENGNITVPENGDQFNRLYRIAVEKKCEIEPLMRLVFALFEAQGGRPTQPVSASSPGLSPTSPSSSDSATHPALRHLTPVDSLVVATG